MELSLCMIVKNEENNLARCLESVKDIVDEMIVVDTGSTDSTVEIAKSFGANVYQHPWNGSFSDARNYSLKQAGGNWILIMDADDEMIEESRQAVRDLIKYSDADAYFFETLSYVGEKPGIDVLMNMNLRLLKNGKGYFFSNPIHEQIYSNILALNPSAKIINKDIKIYHYGYLNKNISEHNKRARNIELLEKELKENPGFPFTLFNLGSEYLAMGDNIKAIGYFEESYKNFKPVDGFSTHLILKMVNCYINLGKLDDALKLIDEGLGFYPEFTDLVYLEGLIKREKGNIIQSIKLFQKCCEMGEAPIDCRVLIGAGTYKASFMLGELFFCIEEYDAAVKSYLKCINQNSEYTMVLTNLVKALYRSNKDKKCLKENIGALRKYQPEDFDTLVFNILIEEKAYDMALIYIKSYEKKSGISAYSKYNRGLCLMYLNKYKQAYRIMGQAKKDPEFLIRSVCMQALIKDTESKFAEAATLLSGKEIDKDNTRIKVFSVLNNLLETSNLSVLCDDEKESGLYTDMIFEILKLLIASYKFEIFEKSLGMLNSVSDSTVLLKLAKLYFSEGYYSLAITEFMRSIKIFDLIDTEGADMLLQLKHKGL